MVWNQRTYHLMPLYYNPRLLAAIARATTSRPAVAALAGG